MIKLNAEESELTGRWLLVDGRMVGDAVTERIRQLIKHHLVELGTDDSGWDVLYRDPDDGRLWELLYPQGDSHGGGPPMLRYVDATSARTKYPRASAAQ